MNNTASCSSYSFHTTHIYASNHDWVFATARRSDNKLQLKRVDWSLKSSQFDASTEAEPINIGVMLATSQYVDKMISLQQPEQSSNLCYFAKYLDYIIIMQTPRPLMPIRHEIQGPIFCRIDCKERLSYTGYLEYENNKSKTRWRNKLLNYKH